MNNGDNGFEIVNAQMKKVYEEVGKYARHGERCILFGPSGSGKEFLAKHYWKQFRLNNRNARMRYSLNCGQLFGDLAHSELFGHVVGSFTGAISNKPGIFEQAKNNVLFLDEVGDLDEKTQKLLLHAIDPGISIAHRLGDLKTYSTRDVHVIAATEQPRENLREAILYRLGPQVDVPGLDQRPDDVPNAVKYFILNAIQKRFDKDRIVRKLVSGSLVTSNEERAEALGNFIGRLAHNVTPKITSRSWPGNLRALRVTVDSAVLQIDEIHSKSDFINQFHYYFDKVISKYSNPKKEALLETQQNLEDSVSNDLLRKKLDLNVQLVFPNAADVEKDNLVCFFMEKINQKFSRKDFQKTMTYSVRTAQLRLKTLVDKNFLRTEGHHTFFYTINESTLLKTVETIENLGELDCPKETSPDTISSDNDNIMQALINNTSSIFLACECKAVRKKYVDYVRQIASESKVLYFSLQKTGIKEILRQLDNQSDNILEQLGIDLENITDLQLSNTTQIPETVLSQEKKQLIVVIEHMETLKTNADILILQMALKIWANYTFIMLGNKMQTVLSGTVEYRVDR